MKGSWVYHFLTVLFVSAFILTAFHPALPAAARYAESTSPLYVKPGGAGDCSDWGQACDLQAALNVAVSPAEIWVAEGVYYPGGVPIARSPSTLGVRYRCTAALSGRKRPVQGAIWQDHKSILSGDLGRDDVTTGGLLIAPEDIRGDNGYHVIVDDGSAATSELDGFYITGGSAGMSATPAPHERGGGISMVNSQRTLRNLVFQANQARSGGGLFVDGGAPVLAGITFYNNHAVLNGGGIRTNYVVGATLTNITFIENLAGYGGGMYNGYITLEMIDIDYWGNTADFAGGGMYNYMGSVEMTDSGFSGNTAGEQGGGCITKTARW